MTAALPPPAEMIPASDIATTEEASAPRADEGSIEVIHSAFPAALDFSSIRVDEGNSSSSTPGGEVDVGNNNNNNEWDPHRVYFNEFLGDPKPDSTNNKTGANDGDSNSHFSPFGIADMDDEDFDTAEGASASAAKGRPPSGIWTKRRWTFRRKNDGYDDDAAHKDEADYGDETLDPLGWPRQPSLLLEEATKDDEDVAGDGGDGDDEDLLGPGLRGRSDCDAGGGSDAVEGEDKIHRLEQYNAAVEPDEASVSNSSHSSEPNPSSSDEEEDEQVEVEYQNQGDDGDDESDMDDDFRDEFQDLILHMARQDKSDDIIDHGAEAAQIEFAAFDPDAEATPPAFEVTWGASPTTECKVDETGDGATHGQESGAESDANTVQVPSRKPALLLKPPPEEKMRKWLATKDKA